MHSGRYVIMCPSPPHLLLTSCVLCDKRTQVDTLLCVHLLHKSSLPCALCVMCDKRTQVDWLAQKAQVDAAQAAGVCVCGLWCVCVCVRERACVCVIVKPVHAFYCAAF